MRCMIAPQRCGAFLFAQQISVLIDCSQCPAISPS
nr:MAG TPA: hypothetical protein [Caudoviricetes sp.]